MEVYVVRVSHAQDVSTSSGKWPRLLSIAPTDDRTLHAWSALLPPCSPWCSQRSGPAAPVAGLVSLHRSLAPSLPALLSFSVPFP
eukprot:4631362-Pleurochrysis_carterae.AAC.1